MMFSVASSILSGKQQQENIKAQNAALKAQWEMNVGITQESLSTLDYRTQVAESEAIRDRIARNIAVKQAAKKAKGEAVVSAAQIRAAGRRVELNLERETGRLAADAISESNVNAQVQLNNITNYFNDTAKRMVDNLNQARPTYGEAPGTTDLLFNAGMTALGSYASMDSGTRKEFNNSVGDIFSKLKKYDTTGYGATPAGIML